MASDHGLQQLIGAAVVDEDVLSALLRDPVSLANRFHLSIPERRFIAGIRARDLEHFAALVEGWTGGWPPLGHRSVSWQRDAALLAG